VGAASRGAEVVGAVDAVIAVGGGRAAGSGAVDGGRVARDVGERGVKCRTVGRSRVGALAAVYDRRTVDTDIEHQCIKFGWSIETRAIDHAVGSSVRRVGYIRRRGCRGGSAATADEESHDERGAYGVNEAHRLLLGLNMPGYLPALRPLFWNRKNAAV
jgi:hypothetical protein